MGAFADRMAAGKGCFITWWMLTLKRTFIIMQKGKFGKAIIAFAIALPEPAKELTQKHNTHILLDIRDKFFRCYTNKNRFDLLRAEWKILIDEYEHDGDISDLLNWIVDEIKERDWQPRLRSPKNSWKHE